MCYKEQTSVDIQITEMKDDDLDEIMVIEKVSFPTPWSKNMFRKELQLQISRNFVARAVGDEKKNIVGYINFWIFADEVHLNNIAIRKDYRGKGVASMMIREMIKRSWDEGALWGSLEVRTTNYAALKLYERYGYVIKGKRPHYYDDSKEDALIMWCDLENAVKRISKNDA